MRFFVFCWLSGITVGLLLTAGRANGLTVDELDATKSWSVTDILIEGNEMFSSPMLLDAVLTKARPWYLPWKARPNFDPVTFKTDLERLRRFYETRGYYGTEVTHELQITDETLVSVRIHIKEGVPVTVAAVHIDLEDTSGKTSALPPLPPVELPVKTGEIFTEAAYQAGEQILRDYFLGQGHAHVETHRRAEVNIEERRVEVHYRVQPGPVAVFGSTRVEGTEAVDSSLILREITYKPGDQFSLAKIAETRQKILALDLFRSVQIAPEPDETKPRTVAMRIRVQEKPPRSIRLGLKYSTQDEIGVQAEWRHRNWFGDGRQLSLLLDMSSITRKFDATLVQPHFLSPRTRGVLSLQQRQEDEETYLLNATRFRPRLEHTFSPTVSAFLGYRVEFVKLNNIAEATSRALGGIKRGDLLSGPSLGLTWNTTEDPFNPQHGGTVSLLADQAGVLWGGDFRFYKIIVEAKKYQRLGWKTLLAGRLKIGLADAFGARDNIPLFERFYAGGEKSVRGYGRRRLGPLSESDDPLGGLSLIEGSLELRRPLWGNLGGAVFLDFGQVSLDSVDLPIDDLQFAAGAGVSYVTPIGPVRLDLGFPFNPPPGDRSWQLHFSIGQFF
jgi:outer membrane protein assembly complex protein YaeT